MAPRTVLVVDADLDARAIVAGILRHHAYQALEAATGEEALALARRHRPDLILIEIRLPAIDGWSLCDILRSTPSTADIPVCFCTATVADFARERSRAAGADCFVSKPFRPRHLVERVERLIGPPTAPPGLPPRSAPGP